ncbi:MAG: NAD(P)H-hydrate dehydratase [Armatimonadetes bacterium]|nr:NAD(P)H-hydrate dehydratase [Armatimonadota bacterium]
MWIADAARSREMDRIATEEFGVPAMVLMERAGLAVFDALMKMLPEGGRITIFCGKGNNGGDGLVVSRHALKNGFHVDCLMACLEDQLTPDTATQLAVSRAQGVNPIFYDDARWLRKADCVGCRDLIVDALLGTGAKGEVHGPIAESIHAINRSGVPVVSVDVPSGIETDSGEDLGESVWALRTVTFGLPKPFLFQGIGLEHSGFWSVSDIGMPRSLLEEPTDARLVDHHFVGNLVPERLRASHKGDNGRVLIVAGSARMPGAATLSCMGAIRSGGGLVTLASVPSACSVLAHHVPEALLMPLPDTDGWLGSAAAEALLPHLGCFDSILIGPGLGANEHSRAFMEVLVPALDHLVCLDADALNLVSEGVKLPTCPTVMTPHPGEMSRLLSMSTAEVQTNRFETVKQAVMQFECAILLKGPYSIIGDVMQPLSVNSSGNPGMACGGMGDVLSGIVTTLLAQDLPPYLAATCGAFWHGLAGDLCAAEIGPIGFTATDLAKKLPEARVKITATCDAPTYSCVHQP